MELLCSYKKTYIAVALLLCLIQFRQYEALDPYQSCRPAEEGKDYTFNFSLVIPSGESSLHIVIEKDETPITNCLLPSNCNDYTSDHKTTLFVNKTTQEIIITITIHNVSRDITYNNGMNWFVIYNRNVSYLICNIDIFARIKSIYCNNYVLEDGLKIICFSSNIYHETLCNISVKYFGNENMVIIHSIIKIQKMSSADKKVYKTNCSVFILREELIPGQYEAVVTMYPNITGSNSDKQFSTHHSHSVNLEYPRITLKDCPEIVEENTESICTCERIDHSLVNISFAWFNSSGQIAGGTGINYLKFLATRTGHVENAHFYCKAKSWIRWEQRNSTISYRPKIIVKVKTYLCKYENLRDELNVTCEIDRVYPEAKCHYTIYYNRSEYVPQVGTTLHYHKVISRYPIYYKSTCVVHIPKWHLVPGQYDIMIYVYTNVTGDTSDRQFGTYTTIPIHIESYITPPKPRTVTLIASLIDGVIGFFLITFGVCIYMYFKQREPPDLLDNCVACKESKDDHSDYNEINEGYILATHTAYQGNVRIDDNYEYRIIADNITRTIHEVEILEENDTYEIIDEQIGVHEVIVETVTNKQLCVCDDTITNADNLSNINIVNAENTQSEPS